MFYKAKDKAKRPSPMMHGLMCIIDVGICSVGNNGVRV